MDKAACLGTPTGAARQDSLPAACVTVAHAIAGCIRYMPASPEPGLSVKPCCYYGANLISSGYRRYRQLARLCLECSPALQCTVHPIQPHVHCTSPQSPSLKPTLYPLNAEPWLTHGVMGHGTFRLCSV